MLRSLSVKPPRSRDMICPRRACRWDDLPGFRDPNVKITAGAVAAVVMTAMLFVIMFALMIAV
ncbi:MULTISPECIES: hypothetical protein [Bradyrhizobium]|jgi:hypothetical protein|uniref:hypothetical protein n=1 Tax=Bradyrhizobium TaxID=374 RepID=UPI0011AE9DDE|nr:MULTISPECIES: hypothetical protein [Bradyrhizobium]